MTRNALPLRGLLWKEFRLVIPLILMLLGVTLLLIVLWSMFQYSSRTLETAGRYIPLILPALYAAGAGAILIAQERENRTLLWFTSLPISAERVFWTKTSVALGGLVVMWTCCWLLAIIGGFADMNFSNRPDSSLADIAFWFLHSVFVTVSGIYTAWRFRNTFASLIAIAPLAVVPYLTIEVAYVIRAGFSGRSMVPGAQAAVIALGVTVAAIVVMTWLAYRSGMKTLSPAEPEPVSEFNSSAWRDAWRPSAPIAPPTTVSTMPFRNPLSSLVWQSIHHNLLALIGLGGLLVVSLGWLFFSPAAASLSEQHLAISLGGVGLFSCWIGVFAFTGDGSAIRMRFLADRGVSPTSAWLGRHLLGISLLSLAVVLYAALSFWMIGMHGRSAQLLPSIAMVALVVWTLYGVSQWTSQLTRMVAAAVVIAPLLAGVVVYWLGFAALELAAPLWLVIFCSSIPMLTTWLAMRWFMDDSGQLRIWITSGVAVTALVVLPMLPAMRTIATWPTMPRSTRAALLVEAEQASRSMMRPQSMMQKESPLRDLQMKVSRSMEGELSGEEALSIVKQYSFAPADRLQLGEYANDISVPLAVDMGILESALASATYHIELVKADAGDDTRIEALGQWIETLTMMTQRFRQSPRWLDQEAADVVEVWLTQTLSSDTLKPHLDRPFAIDAKEMIADANWRSQSRRRAVLASWHENLQHRGFGQPDYGFGGLRPYEWTGGFSSTIQLYLNNRNVDAIVDRSLRLLAAGDNGESTVALRRELHALTCDSTIAFDDGPYSDRLRVGIKLGDVVSLHQTLLYPANQWYAEWEIEAKKLSE